MFCGMVVLKQYDTDAQLRLLMIVASALFVHWFLVYVCIRSRMLILVSQLISLCFTSRDTLFTCDMDRANGKCVACQGDILF